MRTDHSLPSVRYQEAEYHFSIDRRKNAEQSAIATYPTSLGFNFGVTSCRVRISNIQDNDCQATAVESLIPVVMKDAKVKMDVVRARKIGC
jgi:hypothetical protein